MLTRSVGAVRSHATLLGREEVLNVLTHGLAFFGAVIGTSLLVGLAFFRTDLWTVAGVAVYAACITFLFAASTVYHSAVCENHKRKMRRVDHVGVKLLIAGTYTPFVLAELRDGPAMWIGPAVWTLVALGIALQIMLTEEGYYRISLPLYLAMGFVCAPFYQVIVDTLPQDALWMLAAGGAAYMIGVIFFVWESLPYSHSVWHVFVMAGALLHFGAVASCSVIA